MSLWRTHPVSDVIQALRNCINQQLIQDHLDFEEKTPSSTCPSFKLKKHQSGQLITLRFSSDNHRFFPWFKPAVPTAGSCCDYAVFSLEQDRLRVLLLELKSGASSGAFEQIRAGVLICEYLTKTACRLSKLPPPTLEFRGLVVSPKNPPAPPPHKAIAFNQHDAVGIPVGLFHLRPPNGSYLSRFWL